MSTEVNVSQDVQDLISEIKIKNGFDKDSEITYDVGSQTGDGFLSRNIAVTDQKPELYQELTTLAEALDEASSRDIDESAFKEAAKSNIDNFLATLDPIKDKHILKRSENLAQFENLFEWGNKNSYNPDKTDYDILTQGDCWCNNMMFLFEEGNKDEPIEIVLLDWQIIRVTIPVFDLAYFFYTSASEMAMKHIDDYLDLYHRELSDQLKKLGNDSDVLYPYAVFKCFVPIRCV
ncbi:Ecdysteroid kinase-like family [Popillia japonica]|uniref:Ecdysteroid kinase-like family n=1 Tax=Popillia japonica TaxID=7064 RepID=A0AAW1LBX7_POPJA